MAFALAGKKIDDFFLADDGHLFHLFYVCDGTIGRAESIDLYCWRDTGTVLRPTEGAFDRSGCESGCVVQVPDGSWLMLYTGVSRFGRHSLQSIGAARSRTLTRWDKVVSPYTHSLRAVSHPDNRWYEKYGQSDWPGEVWQSPALAFDPETRQAHLFTLGRAVSPASETYPVIGHSITVDGNWLAEPPLPFGDVDLTMPQTLQIVIAEDRCHLFLWRAAAGTDNAGARIIRGRDGSLLELQLRAGTDRSPPASSVSDPQAVAWDEFHLVATAPFTFSETEYTL